MKKKGLIAVILAFGLVFSACSSGGGGGDKPSTSGPVKENDVTVWSAPGTEKVLQDKLDGYEDIRQKAEINVLAAKGEYEGEHLILTSENKDIKDINLVSSDLVLKGDSSKKFPKENIEVFFEKYVHVSRVYDGNGAPVGYYPDALVPMHIIKDYAENTMKGGTNQGLYIRFNVPALQQHGVYSGKLELSYNGFKKDIPVELNVLDLTVSEETHSRSLFISEWQYRLGELDSTQAMLEKYIDAGLEYRISPSGVVIDDSFDDEGIDFYIETSAKFMKNPKCTHISLPFKSKTVDGVGAFDTEVMRKVIMGLAEKSITDNFDYVRKLGCHLVDEPQLNNTLEKTKVMTRLFYETLEKCGTEIENMPIGTAEQKSQLANSARNIRGVITASYEDSYDGIVRSWCPTVNYYDTQEARDKYDAEEKRYYEGREEKWWYTCISPRAPFPTYHTEDTLLSARTMGWMQSEYDVPGNLFWATNVYARYDGSKYVNIEDFYTGDASRFTQVNGDGYLFYPGKPYGVDGPLGSLRLEAIRDGLEEYEILYALKENYKCISEKIKGEIGKEFSAKEIIRNLTTDLYTGTRVATTSSAFKNAREGLYSLAMMSNSNAKMSVIDCIDDNKGNVTYTIYAGDGYEVYSKDKLLSSDKTVSGGKIYTITNKLDKLVNMFELTLKKGDEVYKYTKNLGGKVVTYGAEEFNGKFHGEHATVAEKLGSAQSFGISGSGDLLKLSVGATTIKSQRIKLVSPVVNGFDGNTKRMIISLYCQGLTEELPFTMSVSMERGKYNYELISTKLHNGWNEVSISVDSLDFDRNGKIEFALMLFGDTDDQTAEPARNIWLKDIVVYNK